MVHGSNVSLGCYAMTDKRIEEIYTIADSALTGGQPLFRVHCFPFRMTAARLAEAREDQWFDFWTNLKKGYDFFENNGRPPDCVVDAAGIYRFGPTRD